MSTLPFSTVAVRKRKRVYLALLMLSGSLFSACDILAQGGKANNVTLPARAAFYYPWFPETWDVGGERVFYNPTLEFYNSSDLSVVDSHIRALDYAEVSVGIASWWGLGTHREDERIPLLLERTRRLRSPLKWSVYYEKEGASDPSVAELKEDLTYLQTYSASPAYARVEGKPVLFVYNADDTDCTVAERWARAVQGAWYVVLKVFPGYRDCPVQPDSWHQYAPAKANDHQRGHAYTISPGFWRADEDAPRLARDLKRWERDVRAMVASGEPWQLITTFNEWGEGTAVEAAYEWRDAYLDVLAHDGADALLPAAPRTSAEGPMTVAAAGDISCDPNSDKFNGGAGTRDYCRMGATAELIRDLAPDAVFVLGDIQYSDGTLEKFNASYDLSWGAFKSITYPAVGNHEYLTPGAQGYFDYFGAAAGDPDEGYYSFDLGAWHVVVLNSNCAKAGGCHEGSPQERWLRADLRESGATCLLALWHHPRFSSGQHGGFTSMTTLWHTLQAAGADLALVGHDHHYERFAPQDAQGEADPDGIRQFVVGTGGKNLSSVGQPQPNSEVSDENTYGVLRVVLRPGGYSWEFVPVSGSAFRDAGGEAC